MKIIVNLRGFTLAYQVMFIDDQEHVTITKSTLKNIPEVVSELANKYNCNNVLIYGNKTFAKNISDNIKNTFSAKFREKEMLNVEIYTK